MKTRVLIADDDDAVRLVLASLLVQAGWEAVATRTGAEALSVLNAQPFDLLLSDVRMPEIDGMELLARVRQSFPDLPVILLTAHGTVPLAVEAMKSGATDFILKPFDREELLYSIQKALAATAPGEPKREVPENVTESWIGNSPAMRDVFAQVKRVASGMATVLVRGPSGTGKELVARALHQHSHRRSGPFVKVHCAALPDALLESELFGYEKGAFTGAAHRKPGRVELAQNGTLFLDEIGDITPATQVKLLRLLQEREYERLGGTQTLKADVRFVAATHQPLEQRVQEGTFREDLFYRLNVVPLYLPPLKDRADDVSLLARHFCSVFGKANGKPGAMVDGPALALLESQPWPGNVRQLENFMERLILLSEGERVGADDVRRELERGSPLLDGQVRSEGQLDDARQDAERKALRNALQRAAGNRTVAARLLGISRRTLYNKMEELGVV